MIANKVLGTVTFVDSKKLDDGTKYRVVKVLQMNNQGDGMTVPVTVWDEELEVVVGSKVEFENVNVSPYKSKSGSVGLKVSVSKNR